MTASLQDVVGGARAVVFDIDHTLVDTGAAFRAALRAGLGPWLADIDTHLDEITLSWSRDRNGHYRSFTRGEVDYHTQRLARVGELLEGHGAGPLGDDGYQEFSRLFDAAFEGAWQPFDDAVEAVAALTGAGVPIGALSNAERPLQDRKLAACGLADEVPLLVTVEDFGVGKPDPRVFRRAAELLALEPADVVYVGDEEDIDAAAATAAGLRGVHLRRPADRRHDGTFDVAPEQAGYAVVADLTSIPGALALAFDEEVR